MPSRARNLGNMTTRLRSAKWHGAAIGLLLLAAPALRAAVTPEANPAVVAPSGPARDVFVQFASALEDLQKHYIDPSKIHAGEHSTAALREFIRSLDPEADLYTPDEVSGIDAQVPPDLGDIGVSLALRKDYPTVVTARDNSSAQDTHLFTGDQIIAIDGQPLLHARLFDVAHRLQGTPLSTLKLRVLDPVSGETRQVVVERMVMRPAPGVHLKFLGQGVAYCRVPEFTQPVVESLLTELKKSKLQMAKALVLDLRNNPGGGFDTAMVAARLFLPDKAEIVSLEYGRPEYRTTFVSDGSYKCPLPLVVLVNEGTAAEAEIFAAALQDHKRARLVGSRTFGRGLLFGQFPLPDGSALFIPTAQFIPPSHKPFNSVGLTPDIAVEVPRETERRLETLGFGTFDWTQDKNEVLESDLTLARALQLFAK